VKFVDARWATLRALGAKLRRGRIEPALASRLSQILINQRVILESFDAEKRIQQLEALLDATGNGKVIQLKQVQGGSKSD
jgi:hypothetical protein